MTVGTTKNCPKKTIAKNDGLFYNNMKMHRLRKSHILFVLSFIFSSVSVFSRDILKLDVFTFAGLKYGEISKSIFLNNSSTKVSRLDWEEKNIYEFGIGTDIFFFNLLLSARFSAGLPLNCGNMYDSDWNLSGLKKTYTISECDLKQSFDTQIAISYLFPSVFIFKLAPEIQIQYMYQNLNAHDGYGWYGAKEIRQSLYRKGNCLDNSVIENFFGFLKSEPLYLKDFKLMEQFKQELVEYLSWYDEKRIQV